MMNFLFDQTTGEGIHLDLVRSNANSDGLNKSYILSREQECSIKLMSPGAVTIFMLQVLLTSGKGELTWVWKPHQEQITKIEG